MSSACLIHWIDQLLFGSTHSLTLPPPDVKNLILRMEAENIPWSHIMSEGGLTTFPYLVHGDLNSLIDYLEKQWLDHTPPYQLRSLKTRAVTKFWDELQLLLAKREKGFPPALPVASPRDEDILKQILDSEEQESYDFQSASFWGNVARRFIHLRRSEGRASPLPPARNDYLKKVMQLYDITSRARGYFMHPWTLSLVPYSEYVNAAHWQSASNLEAFMNDRPSHPLTLSIQTLLKRTIDEILNGQKPSAFYKPCERLDALLHNIQVIHEAVQQVPHKNAPPKLIDIFQRLLALSYRDSLWEKDIPPLATPNPLLGTSLLYVTEQLRIAEREKHVLWNHVMEHAEESDSKTPRHTCHDYPYANDTYDR